MITVQIPLTIRKHRCVVSGPLPLDHFSRQNQSVAQTKTAGRIWFLPPRDASWLKDLNCYSVLLPIVSLYFPVP